MNRKNTLSRRHVLRGAMYGGTAVVALPLLDIMLNNNGEALADGNEIPKRFVSWFFGNGVLLNRFEPAIVGAGWEPSEQLMPLAAHKDYLNICTGLRNRCDTLITHHEGMTAFNGYTMTEISGLFSKAGGPTIDVLVGDAIQGDAPIHSVHVGVSKRLSIMDAGTTMFALSHRGPNEPNYPEHNPQAVWANLFGSFVPKPDDSALRIKILDAIRDDVASLKPRLGSLDNQRLEAHLDSVAALEAKIMAAPPVCELPSEPTETNADVNGQEPITSVNQAMSDLIAYAFKCDITRVASVLMIGGAAETTFSEIGQGIGHHYNTHDGNAQDTAVNDGVKYIMGLFSDFLTSLKSTVEPDGKNLLDRTIVYCSSDCSEGLSHSVARQPIILAGHGDGYLQYPGIHYQATPMTTKNTAAGNMSDVLLSVLQCYDATATEIGGGGPYSNTPLPDILA